MLRWREFRISNKPRALDSRVMKSGAREEAFPKLAVKEDESAQALFDSACQGSKAPTVGGTDLV